MNFKDIMVGRLYTVAKRGLYIGGSDLLLYRQNSRLCINPSNVENVSLFETKQIRYANREDIRAIEQELFNVGSIWKSREYSWTLRILALGENKILGVHSDGIESCWSIEFMLENHMKVK